MGRGKSSTKYWIAGGLVLAAGFVAVRVIKAALSNTEVEDEIQPGIPTTTFKADAHLYPPFCDRDLEGVLLEGEFDESNSRQIAVLGVDQTEVNRLCAKPDTHVALARKDGTDQWWPAVAGHDMQLGSFEDSGGEKYLLALYVGAGIHQVVIGVMHETHFTPCRSTKLIALTNKEGLTYDYPNVTLAVTKD